MTENDKDQERRDMDTDNTQGAAEPSPASAGSQPVAWAAVGRNGAPMWLAYHRQDAEGAVVGMAEVVPLYRKPTLTDEEREAIWFFAAIDSNDSTLGKHAATLRNLLERLA